MHLWSLKGGYRPVQGLAGNLPPYELKSIPSILPQFQGPVPAISGAHPWSSDFHGKSPAGIFPGRRSFMTYVAGRLAWVGKTCHRLFRRVH